MSNMVGKREACISVDLRPEDQISSVARLRTQMQRSKAGLEKLRRTQCRFAILRKQQHVIRVTEIADGVDLFDESIELCQINVCQNTCTRTPEGNSNPRLVTAVFIVIQKAHSLTDEFIKVVAGFDMLAQLL